MMEKEFLDWLGSFTINPATLIAIIVVVFTFIIKGNDIYNDFKQKIDMKVEKRANKKIADNTLLKTIDSLSSTVNEFSSDLKEMKELMNDYKEEIGELKSKLSNYEETNTDVTNQIKNIDKKVDLLMDSDKESIRSYILNEYHKWANLKYIDVYSLATIEEKYEKYQLENGNSFVGDIMNELRHLEKRFTVLKDGMDPIQYFEIQPNRMDYNIKNSHSQSESIENENNIND